MLLRFYERLYSSYKSEKDLQHFLIPLLDIVILFDAADSPCKDKAHNMHTLVGTILNLNNVSCFQWASEAISK